jgi:hypothetical protein
VTGAAVPWWGIPALGGAVAFLGVLLAQGVALWIDRRKRVAETQRRWDRERQSSYVAFIAAVYECLDADSARTVKPSKDLLLADSSIQFLASRQVADCAREIVMLIAGNVTRPDGELPSKAQQAMEKFNAAARIELGILPPTRRVAVVDERDPGLLSRKFGMTVRTLIHPLLSTRLKNKLESAATAPQEGSRPKMVTRDE